MGNTVQSIIGLVRPAQRAGWAVFLASLLPLGCGGRSQNAANGGAGHSGAHSSGGSSASGGSVDAASSGEGGADRGGSANGDEPPGGAAEGGASHAAEGGASHEGGAGSIFIPGTGGRHDIIISPAAGAAGASDVCDENTLWVEITLGAVGGLGYCVPAPIPTPDEHIGITRGAVILNEDGVVIDNTGLDPQRKKRWLDGLSNKRWTCLAGQTIGYKCSVAG